ncbi:hypothetical protein GEMRC1_003169 [Eukaryota sp. GEM-RC1]
MSLIICGCYERTVLGFELIDTSLQPVFQHVCHSDTVKALACMRKYFASGSTDEIIHVFDAQKRRELTSLYCHNDTITALCFDNSERFLVSGSKDGKLVLSRTSDWSSVAELRLKASIVSIAIHCDSTICLVLTSDNRFSLIDMAGFKVITSKKLSSNPLSCSFSSDGTKLIIATMADFLYVDIAGKKEIKQTCSGSAKEVLVVGDSVFLSHHCTISKYNLSDFNAEASVVVDFGQRVRGLALVNNDQIAVIGSNGKLSVLDTSELKEVESTELDCRLTCLCSVNDSN